MLTLRRTLARLLALAPLLAAGGAHAQDATTNQLKKDATDIKAVEPVQQNGVFGSLRGDVTFSLTNTDKVVGQPDGLTLNFGVKIDSHVDVFEDAHEWRNSLLLTAGMTKTPILPELVKTTDALAFETIYLYHLRPWFGPFARVRLDTPMFAGTDIRPTPTNYKINRADGTQTQTCDPASDVPCTTQKLPLTDAFQPLTLKESLGMFAQPYKSTKLTIEGRVGLGAQEIFANKQFAVADIPDDATNCPAAGDPTQKSLIPCVEVNELSDVMQLGLEANLEAWGTLYDDKIAYKVFGGIMAPFTHGTLPPNYLKPVAEGGLGGKDEIGYLTNVDVGVNISLKIVEWASLAYEFKAVRVPQLLPDTFQVRNTLLFTMGFGVDNHPPPPPPPAPPGAPAPPATPAATK
jgi:hypothetical protein